MARKKGSKKKKQVVVVEADIQDSSSDSDSDSNDEYLATWVAQSDPRARLVHTHQVGTANTNSMQVDCATKSATALLRAQHRQQQRLNAETKEMQSLLALTRKNLAAAESSMLIDTDSETDSTTPPKAEVQVDKDVQVVLNTARQFVDSNENQNAVDLLTAAIGVHAEALYKDNTTYSAILQCFGAALFRNGETRNAIAVLQHCTGLNTKHSEADTKNTLSLLAQAYDEIGQSTKANEYRTEASGSHGESENVATTEHLNSRTDSNSITDRTVLVLDQLVDACLDENNFDALLTVLANPAAGKMKARVVGHQHSETRFNVLMAAAMSGRIDVVKKLIDVGVDVDLVGADGDSALTHACREHHTDIVKLLLKPNNGLSCLEGCGGGAVAPMHPSFQETESWGLEIAALVQAAAAPQVLAKKKSSVNESKKGLNGEKKVKGIDDVADNAVGVGELDPNSKVFVTETQKQDVLFAGVQALTAKPSQIAGKKQKTKSKPVGVRGPKSGNANSVSAAVKSTTTTAAPELKTENVPIHVKLRKHAWSGGGSIKAMSDTTGEGVAVAVAIAPSIVNKLSEKSGGISEGQTVGKKSTGEQTATQASIELKKQTTDRTKKPVYEKKVHAMSASQQSVAASAAAGASSQPVYMPPPPPQQQVAPYPNQHYPNPNQYNPNMYFASPPGAPPLQPLHVMGPPQPHMQQYNSYPPPPSNYAHLPQYQQSHQPAHQQQPEHQQTHQQPPPQQQPHQKHQQLHQPLKTQPETKHVDAATTTAVAQDVEKATVDAVSGVKKKKKEEEKKSVKKSDTARVPRNRNKAKAPPSRSFLMPSAVRIANVKAPVATATQTPSE